MAVELTDKFFADAAGWEAMKQARSLLATDKVLSSNWTPPVLKGVVQAGATTYRAGLVIKNPSDLENICTCRPSREWGTICAHSVAVGLHHLRRLAREESPAMGDGNAPPARPSALPLREGRRVRRAAPTERGEPAGICVVLPPTLAQGIEAGRVMLFFEAVREGKRTPLNALPPQTSFRFEPEDVALLEAIELIAGGDTPAMLRLGPEEFADLLQVLVGHPRIWIGRTTPVRVEREPWAPAVRAHLEMDGGITLNAALRGETPVLIAGRWVWQSPCFRPAALAGFIAELGRGPVRLKRAQVPLFLGRDWPQLAAAGVIEADFKPEDFVCEPQPPRFVLSLVGGLARLQGWLQCVYGPRVLTLGVSAADEAVWLPDPESPTRYALRDPAAEQAALGRLRAAGFSPPDPEGRIELAGEERVLNFLARDFPGLQRIWEVTLDERLERSVAKTERIEPRFEVTSSGMQWFDLAVSFETGSGHRFSPADIQRLLLGGQSHARLPNGRVALIDTGAVAEFQETLLDCAPEQLAGRYRVPQSQAAFLNTTLNERGWEPKAPPAWRQRARQQSGQAALPCPPLGELDDVLRPYQKQAVAWLWFLRENGFGGILADEMGLGKTLETLAFLRSMRTGGERPGPVLVVCPTSLVFNWAAEARKFTPEIRVLELQGADRGGRFGRIPEHDLVVTSYALIRRDLERYRGIEFDTVVLDEAQHIKNRQTQNAQAVKAVRARHRLVLTGTPLENSVLDLWSIFDFLMPGYLGTAKDFRERYEEPITRARDAAAQARLARRLRPFLLRRLKQDVAAELPARLEQVAYCELEPEQRALYQQIFEAGRNEILETVSAQGAGKGRVAALNALLRLRQICCDPRLLKTSPTSKPDPDAADQGLRSGKVELFAELLEEVLDGGHRVLVFSQFVSMLTLLRRRLEAEGVDYCYLDGSTRDRGAEVDRFQRGQAPVFLISLKAGGTGLNLTRADTVVHFDPWWNPAVEDQATDRAHRLGQTRVVTSYKLITRDTVEEKILQLQARKREVIRATLGGEEQFVENLSWEEIQELFAP
ncbi:MAG: DEAD/DEAH box helicase [Verrucomicrobiales bacterium]|nr:DEAD/DEAH box helicase [Verrucomicrobiales bacterium]MCP5527264.1 DEAD/DEAH box helicase [Verrucomicrobiales bacterium]